MSEIFQLFLLCAVNAAFYLLTGTVNTCNLGFLLWEMAASLLSEHEDVLNKNILTHSIAIITECQVILRAYWFYHVSASDPVSDLSDQLDLGLDLMGVFPPQQSHNSSVHKWPCARGRRPWCSAQQSL